MRWVTATSVAVTSPTLPRICGVSQLCNEINVAHTGERDGADQIGPRIGHVQLGTALAAVAGHRRQHARPDSAMVYDEPEVHVRLLRECRRGLRPGVARSVPHGLLSQDVIAVSPSDRVATSGSKTAASTGTLIDVPIGDRLALARYGIAFALRGLLVLFQVTEARAR